MAKRFETPSYDVEITSDADLEGCDVLLTFKQGDAKLTIRLNDVDGYQVDGGTANATVTLTQEQTGSFKSGVPVEIQANIVNQSGHRKATEIAKTTLGQQLLEEVRAYGSD